jgi:NAD(P)H-dependent FMN reductase
VTRIGIILGSTRPNRNGEQVAHWVLEVASRRHDAYFELLDLRDYPLPHLDEPLPPRSASTRTSTPGSGRRRSPRLTASSS